MTRVDLLGSALEISELTNTTTIIDHTNCLAEGTQSATEGRVVMFSNNDRDEIFALLSDIFRHPLATHDAV